MQGIMEVMTIECLIGIGLQISFEDMDQSNDVLQLVINLSNNVRLWENNGFSPQKVKKNQVEKAFAYVQRYPESESIREAFFDMLNDSDEKDNIKGYKTKPVISETMNHQLKNLGGNGKRYKGLSGNR